MKKLILLMLVLVMSLSCLAACGDNEDTSPVYAEMSVKGYGKVIMELDPKAAPITVKNFVGLVNEGFYDGLTFHRVIVNFMIQGGAPEKKEDTPPSIKGEFASNGYDGNYISHVRGVISMARSSDPNSASSQFFICNADASASLDGEYAAFGRVIEGMEVVDKITEEVFPRTAYADYYGNYYEYDSYYGVPYHYIWQQYGNGMVENEEDEPIIEYIKILEDYRPDASM